MSRLRKGEMIFKHGYTKNFVGYSSNKNYTFIERPL